MRDDLGDRIRANPKYQELVSKRNSYSWMMTIIMLAVYYGYILLIAFNKEFLAQKNGAGVMSIGIPIGVGVILFTIIITGRPEPEAHCTAATNLPGSQTGTRASFHPPTPSTAGFSKWLGGTRGAWRASILASGLPCSPNAAAMRD